MLDVQAIKQDFPILGRKIHGHPLVYLDNAATSQKPKQVIRAISNYYQNSNANVHRGIHTLGDESTQLYQNARLTVARFIGTQDPNELIFVRNTTEAINLVAQSWGLKHLNEGDEVVVTELEHHSNFVTWQRVCKKTGAKLIHLPVTNNGDLALEYLSDLVGKRVKLVALTHISNVLGTIIDIQHVAKTIKQINKDIRIIIDAAQSVPHMPIHVHDLQVDFLAFSGHKICGPMGIGGLWVKKAIQEEMDPFLVGGGMIKQVNKDETVWADMPDKFDAGTPDVAGAVGLAAACDYLNQIGLIKIHEHEQEVLRYGLQEMEKLENDGLVTLYGLKELNKRAGILTFNVNGIHAHDVAQILDREKGVAIRSGHHCNQPWHDKHEIPATCRASFYLYNNFDDIDVLIDGIGRAIEIFKS